MIRGISLIGAALGLLVACTPTSPVTRKVIVPGTQFANVRGEADLVVRTFARNSDGDKYEIVGAACTVLTSLYETNLATPAKLVVPSFGANSPELYFTCEYGQLRGNGSVRIRGRDYDDYDHSLTGLNSGISINSDGNVGVAVVLGGVDPGVEYPDADILLR